MRCSRTRLPPRVFDDEAFPRPGVRDPGGGQGQSALYQAIDITSYPTPEKVGRGFPSPLEIRAATSADAAGVSELLSARGCGMALRPLAERLDAIRQGPGVALIAMEWSPPSGLVVLHWYRTLHAEHPIAQIDILLVASDDCRRGIGRLLVKAAAQAARVAGCDALALLAPSDDMPMSGFCRATGFAETGSTFVRALRKKG